MCYILQPVGIIIALSKINVLVLFDVESVSSRKRSPVSPCLLSLLCECSSLTPFNLFLSNLGINLRTSSTG